MIDLCSLKIFPLCSKVDVLYGGTEIFDQEVSMTIYHDILLSIPTFVAIFVLLFVFTSFSLWLTICGLLSIIYSFCLAYFCYHVFFGIEALGLLNVVSVFVIIGIGKWKIAIIVFQLTQDRNFYWLSFFFFPLFSRSNLLFTLYIFFGHALKNRCTMQP